MFKFGKIFLPCQVLSNVKNPKTTRTAKYFDTKYVDGKANKYFYPDKFVAMPRIQQILVETRTMIKYFDPNKYLVAMFGCNFFGGNCRAQAVYD